MLSPDMDIRIDLNSDTFIPADKDELAEQLSTETDLRIESDVAAYAGVEGGPLPPDVALYILHSLFPIADVYANVLASVIADKVKSAFGRQGKIGTQATFSVMKLDDEGRILREVRGETDDPEIIKDLIQQANKEDQA